MEPPANPGDGPVELEFTEENLEAVSCCCWNIETSGKWRKFFALLAQDAVWPKRESINDACVS